MLTNHINYRLTTLIIFLLVLVVICSGCWDRRELDTISFVAGIGLDSGTQKDCIRVTTQIIDVSAVVPPGQGGGGGSASPFWNITAEGQTLFSATRECSDISPRRLFYAHNQVLVFSEELAREGIADYLDFFIRDVEPRTTVWMVVTPGKASELLQVKTRLSKVPALNLNQLIRDRSATSHTPGINLQQFSQRILSPATVPIASWVTLVDDGDSKRLMTSGTAVFDKNTKMIGRLGPVETRGMMWIIGEVQGGIMVIESPECGDGKKASMEILKASSKIEPQIKDGKVKIRVKIKESSSLGEDTCAEDPLNPEIWAELQQRNTRMIYEEAMLAVKKARELNADVFGFGDAVHKKYPQEWKTLEPQWEEIFPDLEVEIQVESRLVRTGMILKPIQ